MSFHNTCDLAITTPVPSKQHDEIENLDEGDDCNEDEPENSDDENESDNNMKDSIRELFQEFLLMILGLVRHRLKNHIIQLESIRTFALSVEA
ncbi:unnamed protein product [Rhizophagus irregularis]|nr:unnamed protein product [Rhizophagus irregularis]